MKFKTTASSVLGGVPLSIASRPLQFIAALAALIFVINFTLEVLVFYKASFAHLVQVLCLIEVLSIWALLEVLIVARQQNWGHFKKLILLLMLQVFIPVVRLTFLLIYPPEVSSDWLPSAHAQEGWHYLFLIPISLVFMGVHHAIVYLFTLNEKINTENTEKQMLGTLNALALARDNETGNHIIRTQNYVKSLALRLRQLGHYKKELDDRCIDLLHKAAPLHDIGKVGIPDNILNKSGKFTDAEWDIMKSHTSVGESVLSSAGIDMYDDQGVVRKAIQIAGSHHEKWDGTGYPRGLKGEEIPLSARIMALADVYDALVSERVYKAGWTHQDAINEIVSKCGIHFDPMIVEALIEEQANFEEIAKRYRDC